MQSATVTVSAAGNSPWVAINYLQRKFGVSLFCSPSSGAVLTYKVQHSVSGISTHRSVAWTRSTTTVTVTDTGHNLSAGDSLNVKDTGNTAIEGFFDVASVVDANTYTYTVANTGTTSGTGVVASGRVFPHSVITAATTRTDGNYAFPVRLVRLVVTSYTSGSVTMTVLQGAG
jgi:hypothetical protein